MGIEPMSRKQNYALSSCASLFCFFTQNLKQTKWFYASLLNLGNLGTNIINFQLTCYDNNFKPVRSLKLPTANKLGSKCYVSSTNRICICVYFFPNFYVGWGYTHAFSIFSSSCRNLYTPMCLKLIIPWFAFRRNALGRLSFYLSFCHTNACLLQEQFQL